VIVRNAKLSEIDQLASIWYHGWRDAHADILPAALARYRTLESFMERLALLLSEVRVVDLEGRATGFSITKKDELYQLYVSVEARGKGVAAALLADAESRIAANGATTAWLACAIGNQRAARFYQRNGWSEAGIMTSELPTAQGTFPLEVWRYEKRLDQLLRPKVGVAHVTLETDRMIESGKFMQTIGMRLIHQSATVSVYEMRGATHLILMRKDQVLDNQAAFDLMVDDIDETHRAFIALGLQPTPIEARPEIDHRVFTVREPAGHVITFFSSHASGKPV
jgi:GNAT superfamily N-acetyltransferase